MSIHDDERAQRLEKLKNVHFCVDSKDTQINKSLISSIDNRDDLDSSPQELKTPP